MIKLDLKPTDKMLRTFALIGVVAFGVLALTVYLWNRIVFIPVGVGARGPLLWTFGGLAVYCLLARLLLPRVALPLYVVMTIISFPIGFVMSYLIFGVLFYLIITPIGLFFRLIGRDAMTRRFEPAAQTYWVRRRPVTDPRRYFRQF